MDNSKIGQHISGQFNKELEDVRNKVLTMGGLVEQQIELAVTAFSTGDLEMAELVIKQDNQQPKFATGVLKREKHHSFLVDSTIDV